MCQDQVTRIYNRMNSISQHISRIRHNKANTNVFITLMTKCLIQRKRSTNTKKNSPKLSRAPQGHRLGNERLEVLVVLVALSELPRVGRN